MKAIFDFAYCSGEIHAGVVWYSVKVGNSEADRRAHAFIVRLAEKSGDYLYTKHTQEMADFKQSVALSLFPAGAGDTFTLTNLLRQRYIDVVSLARMLRHYPATFLNSDRAFQKISTSFFKITAKKHCSNPTT